MRDICRTINVPIRAGAGAVRDCSVAARQRGLTRFRNAGGALSKRRRRSFFIYKIAPAACGTSRRKRSGDASRIRRRWTPTGQPLILSVDELTAKVLASLSGTQARCRSGHTQ
jgi:hypothetical protein